MVACHDEGRRPVVGRMGYCFRPLAALAFGKACGAAVRTARRCFAQQAWFGLRSEGAC
jgi:hypothetical protein